MEQKSYTHKDRQNLIALFILAAGLFAGSLFIDLAQLATGSGFSTHALRQHDVITAAGRTWVAYSEPRVELVLVTDSQCQGCQGTEGLMWIRRIVPTAEVRNVDSASAEGKRLIAEHSVTALPAFLFSNQVQDTQFYQEAPELFRETGKRLAFDMTQIGLPAGRYLEPPTIEENDIVVGNPEAPVTLVVYTDFECEYCKDFHADLEQLRAEFGEDVAVVSRHLPLSFHVRAPEAAVAAQCAASQDKFSEYADALFERQAEWATGRGNAWFIATARTLGLDLRQFQACLADQKVAEKLDIDAASAYQYGITGTPSTFVNGTLLSGAVDYAILKETVSRELGR